MNRVALVTGGSRGIGAATALRLAQAGLSVAVGFRQDRTAAEATVGEIRAQGGEATAVGLNVSDAQDVDDAFQHVEGTLGPVAVLVMNAGEHRAGRVHELRPSDWNSVIGANLTGAFLCTRRAVPAMIANQWGRLVCVSSAVGLRGFPGDCAYAASKAGLIGFTKALALELARDQITVNAVAPGFIDTEMTRALVEEVLDRQVKATPLRRTGDVDEVADAVAFLVGNGFVTGSTVVVDGGWTLA